jgi:hypothetical protein
MRMREVMECLGTDRVTARAWLDAFGVEPVRVDRWGAILDESVALRVIAIAIDARTTAARGVSLRLNCARRISIRRKLARGLQHGQA